MLKIEGVYRNGRVELLETPPAGPREMRVLVTFFPSGKTDLRDRNIDESQAADLRARLKPFAEDWDRPEMDVYDEL